MKLAVSLWLTFLGLVGVAFSKATDPYLGDILIAFERAVDCKTCHDLLVPVQKLARLGDDAFVGTFTTICKILQLDDDDVCEGRMSQRGPIVAQSLRGFSLQSVTATKFCIAAFQLCPSPPVTPYKIHFPKPKPTHPKKFKSQGRKPIEVVHFSDVHIDRQYTVGAEANCTKNICCRNFADHHGPTLEPAGPFGNSMCDSPPDLATSMLQAIGDVTHARFAIFTGDVCPGDSWEITREEASHDLNAWNNQMAQHLRIPVYPTLGNHDSSPVNDFIPRDAKTHENSQWVYDIQAAGWDQWIGGTAANEVRHGSGSYATLVPGTKLMILSFNSQLYYRQNMRRYDSDEISPDPDGILAFMVAQLQLAEDKGYRVWIIAHIPPGKPDFSRDQSHYLDEIVTRYINNVAGQFYGHSHKDQFEMSYSDWDNINAQTAHNVALVSPAMTPTSGPPSFKSYLVDPDTYEIMDAKVYLTNNSHPDFQIKPKWELYYSARESYGPLVGLRPEDPLNAPFWHKLTEVFERNDTAFQLWNTRQSRGGFVGECSGACKNSTICAMRALRSENNCEVQGSKAGVNFKRDVAGSRSEHAECEGDDFGSMFGGAISAALAGEPGLSAEMKSRIQKALGDL